MNFLFVVNNPKDWPLEIPGVTVLPARTYLTDPRYFDYKAAKVFNLCRSYKYQSAGYYVSLLAAARGHHPLPSLATIQDLREADRLPHQGWSLGDRRSFGCSSDVVSSQFSRQEWI